MLASSTLSVPIERDWRAVYEALWRPEDFTRWASGLSRAPLERVDEEWWSTQGPEGPI